MCLKWQQRMHRAAKYENDVEDDDEFDVKLTNGDDGCMTGLDAGSSWAGPSSTRDDRKGDTFATAAP